MDDLLYKTVDGIGFVTFNRPASRNALTFAMYEELAEICQRLDADRTIKALVLTGAGETAVAAGTDISQFRSFAPAPDALAYEARTEAVARQVASHAPLTLQVTKEALRRLRPKLDASEDRDLILTCYLSRDFREGMDAFLNKRTPEWQGE